MLWATQLSLVEISIASGILLCVSGNVLPWLIYFDVGILVPMTHLGEAIGALHIAPFLEEVE